MEENRKDQLNFESETITAITPKKKSVFLIVWQVIVALLFISVTAFLTFFFLDVINAPPPDEGSIDGRGFGLVGFIFLAIIIGGIGYLANIITSIVGIVVSVMNREKGYLWNNTANIFYRLYDIADHHVYILDDCS